MNKKNEFKSKLFRIYLKQVVSGINKRNVSIKNILTLSKQNDATKRVPRPSSQTIFAALIDMF